MVEDRLARIAKHVTETEFLVEKTIKAGSPSHKQDYANVVDMYAANFEREALQNRGNAARVSRLIPSTFSAEGHRAVADACERADANIEGTRERFAV